MLDGVRSNRLALVIDTMHYILYHHNISLFCEWKRLEMCHNCENQSGLRLAQGKALSRGSVKHAGTDGSGVKIDPVLPEVLLTRSFLPTSSTNLSSNLHSSSSKMSEVKKGKSPQEFAGMFYAL